MKFMKKILVFAALVLTAAFSANAENYSFEYDYSTYDVGPVDFEIIEGGMATTNESSYWATYSLGNKWDDKTGIFLISAPSTLWNTDGYTQNEPFKSGISVVDFGGKIGKLLCINGNDSGLKNGEESVGEMGKITRWVRFIWYLTNANLTGSKVRIVMKYAVYSKSSDVEDYLSDLYYKADTGTSKSIKDNYNTALQSNVGEIVNWEEFTYDLENALQGPNLLDLSINGGGGNNTRKIGEKAILVKSIKLYTIETVEYPSGKSYEFPFDLTSLSYSAELNDRKLKNINTDDNKHNAKYYYAIGSIEDLSDYSAYVLSYDTDDEGNTLEYKEIETDSGVWKVNGDQFELNTSYFNSSSTQDTTDDATSYIPSVYIKVLGGASNDIELAKQAYRIKNGGDPTGVNEVEREFEWPVEFFNLNGMRVKGDNLPAGVYIRRQGSCVSKVLVR